jgi:hypothetical protein
MPTIPLTTALAEHLTCDPKQLSEQLNNPFVISKITEYLKDKKLETTYLDKTGAKKQITFGNISLRAVCDTDAFEGYLGFSIHHSYYFPSFFRSQTPSIFLRQISD